MKYLFILFSILTIGIYGTAVGVDFCTVYVTESTCDASDYCYWEATCKNRPCYIVNDIAACRYGSPLPTGALSSDCDSLETFSLQYDNVCCDKGEGRLNFALVRYVIPTEGTSTASTDPTPIGTITSTVDTTNMFKLYTINPFKMTTFTELTAILTAYDTTYATLLSTDTQSHPYYMERIIQQTLQILRDHFYIIRTTAFTDGVVTSAFRTSTLTKLWTIGKLLLTRITTFSPNYYQTNYYFINFASIPINRQSLTVNGQLNTVTVSWTSYTQSGFMQVISFPVEQFGVNNALSDALWIIPYDNTRTVIAGQSYSLTWAWTDPTLQVVLPDVKVYAFDKLTTIPAASPSATTSVGSPQVTCNSATKSCVATPFIGEQVLYFTYGPGLCNSKNEVQCRLSIQATACTWSGTACS